MPDIETHPIEPFLPREAKILICGTFPPSKNRWSMDFYYPNFINDMWRIFGIVYFNDKEALVDAEKKTFRLPRIKALLKGHGIALSDTGRQICRLKGNASDKHLDILTPIDLCGVLAQMPECMNVATTGEKAARVIAEITATAVPRMGEYSECDFRVAEGDVRHMRLWRMPSSSRAYPMKLEAKAQMYATMLGSLSGKN